MDRPGVPGIGIFLTASTAHLPPSDHARLLSGEARLDVAYSAHPLGYWVWVPADLSPHCGEPEADDLNAPYGMSPAFAQLLRYARRLGCEYVKLDRYGALIPELPTFDDAAPEVGAAKLERTAARGSARR